MGQLIIMGSRDTYLDIRDDPSYFFDKMDTLYESNIPIIKNSYYDIVIKTKK